MIQLKHSFSAMFPATMACSVFGFRQHAEQLCPNSQYVTSDWHLMKRLVTCLNDPIENLGLKIAYWRFVTEYLGPFYWEHSHNDAPSIYATCLSRNMHSSQPLPTSKTSMNKLSTTLPYTSSIQLASLLRTNVMKVREWKKKTEWGQHSSNQRQHIFSVVVICVHKSAFFIRTVFANICRASQRSGLLMSSDTWTLPRLIGCLDVEHRE
jgi:hypothetical protein